MNQWQQGFAKRVEALRETALKRFESFADGVLAEVYEAFVEFASRYDFQCSAPQHARGSRFYKFALSEDAYVLIYFRARGLDGIECEHECSVPGRGCGESGRSGIALADADSAWVERCLQVALDDLVSRLSEAGSPSRPAPELVGA
ncbi:MAG: hypothetical protein HRF43_06880 [Phycisphaerae bacterium]|jgi:hypothetical protein